MNVIERFHEFLGTLRDTDRGDLYRIMSAQRGPDGDDPIVYDSGDPMEYALRAKGASSGRVRAIFWGPFADDINGDVRESPLTVEEQAAWTAWRRYHATDFKYSHFLDHYNMAVGAIQRITGYHLPTETQGEKP